MTEVKLLHFSKMIINLTKYMTFFLTFAAKFWLRKKKYFTANYTTELEHKVEFEDMHLIYFCPN